MENIRDILIDFGRTLADKRSLSSKMTPKYVDNYLKNKSLSSNLLVKINECFLTFDVCDCMSYDCDKIGVIRQNSMVDGMIPVDIETAKFIKEGMIIDFNYNDVWFIFKVEIISIQEDKLMIYCKEDNYSHKGCLSDNAI